MIARRYSYRTDSGQEHGAGVGILEANQSQRHPGWRREGRDEVQPEDQREQQCKCRQLTRQGAQCFTAST